MTINEPTSGITKTISPLTPEQRRVVMERFDRANQVIATGDFDYGIQLLLTCCKLDPANLQYRQTLRRTQKAKYDNNLRGSRLASVSTVKSRTRMKLAKRNQGYLEILEYGEIILSSNPWDLDAQMDMAEAADNLGLLDVAIFLLDQARQKYPKDATLNRALARLFEKRGNFAHAITLWQLVKEVAPKDVEASHKAKDLAASETIKRGNYVEGASASSEQPSLNATGNASESPTGTTTLGKTAETAALASGTSKSAKKETSTIDRISRETTDLLQKIQASPTDPSLYLQLAHVYARHHQFERARSALQQGLSATGNHYSITYELLELELDPLRKDLAITEHKIAQAKLRTSDDTDESPSLSELEVIHTKLKKEINQREIDLWRAKSARFPNEFGHRIELGIRLFRAELYDQAIVEFQQARRDPRQPWKALLNLGHCFKKRNNWKLAQRNYEEALAQLPSTEEEARKEVLYELAIGLAEHNEFLRAVELAHELANLDFSFRNISTLIDQWEARLQEAES